MKDQNQDLELEAIKTYPAWPDRATHIIHCKKYGFEACRYFMGAFYDASCDKMKFADGVWQVACTREHHIRRRIKLFENSFAGVVFIRTGGVTIPRPTQAELDYIKGLEPKLFIGDAAQKPKEGSTRWVPEVGVECEIAEPYSECGHKYPQGHIVKIYSKFTDDRGVELFAFVDPCGKVGGIGTAKLFRPLKTEVESGRDRLIDLLIADSAIENKGGTAFLMVDRATAERLVDAGYRKNV